MKDILLLHGALGAKSQFNSLQKLLEPYFRVHCVNFSGHGGEPFNNAPFSIKLFAEEVVQYQDEEKIDELNVFGYSMGGYVGLYLARHFHSRIKKVFTLGTKFSWNSEIAEREIKMLDVKKMKEKIPKFYEELEIRHSPQSLELILQKTARMMLDLGKKNELSSEDFKAVKQDVLVALGDRDRMVTIEETFDVYKKLPNGKLLILPGTPHPFEQNNLDRLNWEIRNFFGNSQQ